MTSQTWMLLAADAVLLLHALFVVFRGDLSADNTRDGIAARGWRRDIRRHLHLALAGVHPVLSGACVGFRRVLHGICRAGRAELVLGAAEQEEMIVSVEVISSKKALQRLRDGNARFVAGETDRAAVEHEARRKKTVTKQSPFAIVLGCSDSRVPVESVFDQGIGDLFVVRVAGNIAARSQIGSIEFAAELFGVRLIVVLGHSRCGAIEAVVEELRKPSVLQSDNLDFIVDKLRPSVEQVMTNGYGHDPDMLVAAVGRENVRRSMDTLQQDSTIISQLVEHEDLTIVGAEYSLQTGVVEFF
jgi:carbonic anhydrase